MVGEHSNFYIVLVLIRDMGWQYYETETQDESDHRTGRDGMGEDHGPPSPPTEDMSNLECLVFAAITLGPVAVFVAYKYCEPYVNSFIN